MKRRYKDTVVGKGSSLEEALHKSEKEAKKVYAETTERFCKLYSKEDREYFTKKHNGGN